MRWLGAVRGPERDRWRLTDGAPRVARSGDPRGPFFTRARGHACPFLAGPKSARREGRGPERSPERVPGGAGSNNDRAGV